MDGFTELQDMRDRERPVEKWKADMRRCITSAENSLSRSDEAIPLSQESNARRAMAYLELAKFYRDTAVDWLYDAR